MSLASKASRSTARPLRDVLQEEIAYWKERVESGGRAMQSTAWENIRKRQAQLMKLTRLQQRQQELKEMQRRGMAFS